MVSSNRADFSNGGLIEDEVVVVLGSGKERFREVRGKPRMLATKRRTMT